MIPARAVLKGGRADGHTCTVMRWPDHMGGLPGEYITVTVVGGTARVMGTDVDKAIANAAPWWETYTLTRRRPGGDPWVYEFYEHDPA